jgi:hypothetical protein
MGLGARLAKLEEKAARVIRCAWCRVNLVEDYQQKARGRKVTTDYVMRSCPFCGNAFKVDLERFSAKERESFVLWAYTFQGETYRDERAYAAEQWWMCRSWIQVFSDPEHRRKLEARQRAKQDKPDAYARERAVLKAEADRLAKAEVRRQRREYGPRTFPLVSTLRELKAGLKDLERQPYTSGYVFYPQNEKLARQVLIYARCMEACELVLWGTVEPETAAWIEARMAEIAEFDARREREEKERREREVRGGLAAHTAPATRMSPPPASEYRQEPEAPVSRFRTNGSAVPRSSLVIDPTSAHVPTDAVGNSIPVADFYDPNHPDAVQFQRSTPPDPTQGLTIADVTAEREQSRKSRLYYRPDDYEGDRRY